MIQTIATYLLTVSALSASPQAVVFDFGGVMTGTPDRESIVQFLCDSFHLTHEEFKIVNIRKKKAVDNGMSDEAFWLAYAKEQGISLPEDWSVRFKEVMKQAIHPNPDMYRLVDELKDRNLKVGLLSNIDKRLANFIREFGLYRPFHPCILSCDIGVEKPDSRIYRILLLALDLPANKVVFIDDRQENIEAASRLGIDAILFESDVKLRTELERRGLLVKTEV